MDGNLFEQNIYQKSPHFVLGFHGCDKTVADAVLNSQTEHLKPSQNTYDWLGNGVYFWLNDPQRAYEWACQTKKRKPELIKEPYVIGAIIDLGYCLNLCERPSIQILKKSYNELRDSFRLLGYDINDKIKNKAPDEGGFNLIRPLDCAVINNIQNLSQDGKTNFDTVYGYFQEGSDAFEGAGIKEKSHIQICVRNIDCILGYFLPRLK